MHEQTDTRTRWSPERTARLGFLVGQGLDARQVAEDPAIGASAKNVHRQARRFGLTFERASLLGLPRETLERLDAAARSRRVTREGLMRNLLVGAGARADLIDTLLRETR